MSRKKKVLPLLENVEITAVAAEGKALARVDDMVVFVPYVVPGDVVDLQVTRKKHHYAEAVAVRFHKYGEARTQPFCADCRLAIPLRLSAGGRPSGWPTASLR